MCEKLMEDLTTYNGIQIQERDFNTAEKPLHSTKERGIQEKGMNIWNQPEKEEFTTTEEIFKLNRGREGFWTREETFKPNQRERDLLQGKKSLNSTKERQIYNKGRNL